VGTLDAVHDHSPRRGTSTGALAGARAGDAWAQTSLRASVGFPGTANDGGYEDSFRSPSSRRTTIVYDPDSSIDIEEEEEEAAVAVVHEPKAGSLPRAASRLRSEAPAPTPRSARSSRVQRAKPLPQPPLQAPLSSLVRTNRTQELRKHAHTGSGPLLFSALASTPLRRPQPPAEELPEPEPEESDAGPWPASPAVSMHREQPSPSSTRVFPPFKARPPRTPQRDTFGAPHFGIERPPVGAVGVHHERAVLHSVAAHNLPHSAARKTFRPSLRYATAIHSPLLPENPPILQQKALPERSIMHGQATAQEGEGEVTARAPERRFPAERERSPCPCGCAPLATDRFCRDCGEQLGEARTKVAAVNSARPAAANSARPAAANSARPALGARLPDLREESPLLEDAGRSVHEHSPVASERSEESPRPASKAPQSQPHVAAALGRTADLDVTPSPRGPSPANQPHSSNERLSASEPEPEKDMPEPTAQAQRPRISASAAGPPISPPQDVADSFDPFTDSGGISVSAGTATHPIGVGAPRWTRSRSASRSDSGSGSGSGSSPLASADARPRPAVVPQAQQAPPPPPALRPHSRGSMDKFLEESLDVSELGSTTQADELRASLWESEAKGDEESEEESESEESESEESESESESEKSEDAEAAPTQQPPQPPPASAPSAPMSILQRIQAARTSLNIK
jgi:hypothetical protein